MDISPIIQAIAAAVVQQLQANGATPAGAPQTSAPAPAFVPPPAAPVTQQAAPPPPAASAMPPGPSFLAAPAAPATPPPAAGGAPFTDAKGLTDYAMSVYQALGPAKGAGVQQIITWLGHQNINDVRPDQYAAFYQAAEQLKAS